MLAPLTYPQVVTDPVFILPFLISTVVLTTAFFKLPSTFPTFFTTHKSRAWLLTALTAFTMTLGSLPFLYTFFTGSVSLADTPLINSGLAVSLCGIFASYCVTDLALGTFYYRKEVDPLSGYLHHTMYAWMVTTLTSYHVPGGFCTLAILELPTLVMSVGQINKKWRNDMLFGTTFFVTRICLHAFFVVEIWRAWPGRQLYWFLLAVLPLHLMWFRGWVIQQIRIRKGVKKPHIAAISSVVEDVRAAAVHKPKQEEQERKVAPAILRTDVMEEEQSVTKHNEYKRISRLSHRLRTGSSLLELDHLADAVAIAPVMVGSS